MIYVRFKTMDRKDNNNNSLDKNHVEYKRNLFLSVHSM